MDIVDEIHRGGGVANIRGIEYQMYYAIYYFLSSDISEILIEWLDEDVVIVNEDRSFPSLEFIQCKYIDSGVLYFSRFCSEVLGKFARIFERLKRDDPLTRYSFTTVCNKGFDKNLDNLTKIPELLRNNVSFEGIEKIYGRTILAKIKKYLTNEEINLYFFLQALNFFPNATEEDLIRRIRKCLVEFGSTDPSKDLSSMLGYFIEKKSGKVTKNQLKNDLQLDYHLLKTPESTSSPFGTQLSYKNIEAITAGAKESYDSLSELVSRIDELRRIIDLAELTTDQLSSNESLYPLGTMERKDVERSAEDVMEIRGDVRECIRKMKEDIRIVSTKYEETIYLREKFKLDRQDWEGAHERRYV